MKRGVNESELGHLVRELAKKTRQEIEQAQLNIDDFESICQEYNIKFTWKDLSLDTDGFYSRDFRLITLNKRVTHLERRNFSFCHELMHDRIVRDDDLYEMIHEFTCDLPDDDMEIIIERLCNIGAAEILIPSDEIRKIITINGLSTDLIPELCERFNASSLAIAFKLISLATHRCYLLIAEAREVEEKKNQPSLLKIKATKNWQLYIVYSGKSSSAKYTLGKNYPVLPRHLMYEAFKNKATMVQGRDDIPRRSSTNRSWIVDCDCIAHNGWVFGFFHVGKPVSSNQLRLL